MLFDLQVHPRAGWTVVSVIGELDLAAAPRVRQAMLQVVTGGPGSRDTPERGPRVILDLGAVDFIDSSGLGIVLGAVKRVRAAGGTLRVVIKEPQVRQVFALTKLDQILLLAASVDDAVTAPTAPGPVGDEPRG